MGSRSPRRAARAGGPARRCPEGRFDELVDLLWKALRKTWRGFPDRAFDTPFGQARWIEKGKGQGRGLIVGLHGGGEGAGDAQSATRFFSPSCLGMYPQGIRLVHDTWNTVHGERFVLTLLEIARIEHEIDPDRVYVMGFSMGGTGSWFLAGRHPDQFAGASPLAGVFMASPQSQVASADEVEAIQHGLVPNVRNLSMNYFIGLADRNCMPGTYLFAWRRILELRAQDPGGYKDIVFQTHPGLGHEFPPGEPKRAIEWLQERERDPLPEKIVWEYASDPFPRPEPDDPLPRIQKRRFYWLFCEEPRDRMWVEAERKGNRIDLRVRGADPSAFSIYLRPGMLDDPSAEVVVTVNGDTAYRGRPESRVRHVIETLSFGADRSLVFDRRIDLH